MCSDRRRRTTAGNQSVRPRAVASPLVSAPPQQSGGNGAQPATQTPVPVAPPPEFSAPPETYKKARAWSEGHGLWQPAFASMM